jgi:hypothetical protein
MGWEIVDKGSDAFEVMMCAESYNPHPRLSCQFTIQKLIIFHSNGQCTRKSGNSVVRHYRCFGCRLEGCKLKVMQPKKERPSEDRLDFPGSGVD